MSSVAVQRLVSPLAFREAVYNHTNQIDIGVGTGMKALHSRYIWLDDLGMAVFLWVDAGSIPKEVDGSPVALDVDDRDRGEDHYTTESQKTVEKGSLT
jgi:hypothetical protein